MNTNDIKTKCVSECAEPKQVTVHAIQITVHKIDGFSDSAGFMDRTDPYVSLQLGKEKHQTSVKNDVRPSEKYSFCPVSCAVASR